MASSSPAKGLVMLVLFLLGGAQPVLAQLRVGTDEDIEALVQQLVGQGVKISNIRLDCPSDEARAYGSFRDPTGTLGIRSGLLLTTGSATNAIGPNDRPNERQSNQSGEVSNPYLAPLVDSDKKLFDDCNLVFDVLSLSDTLEFFYVFGSEEYPEFIDEFHDVFGFFLSGPGIGGSRNIATLPNSSVPISVSNVNQNTNEAFYVDNGIGNTPFINLHIQYDGFTKRLVAKQRVLPCQTYTLRLSIADVKDKIYDSGVFIESKSIRSRVPLVEVEYEHPELGRQAIEGCSRAFLVFERNAGISNEVPLQFRFSGTARAGVDFSLPDSNLTIPAGQKSIRVPVTAFADTLEEGPEETVIELLSDCPELPVIDRDTLRIGEDFDAGGNELNACANEPLQLNPNPNPSLSFTWQERPELSCSQCPSPTVQAAASDTFFARVSHRELGCTDSAVPFPVTIGARPAADFSFNLRPEYTAFDLFFTNKSENAEAFQWRFGDGSTSQQENPRHSIPPETVESGAVNYPIRLIATSEQPPCSDTLEKVIRLVPPDQVGEGDNGGGNGNDSAKADPSDGFGDGSLEAPLAFLIPNVITPEDGNNKNDAFQIKGIVPGVWQLRIYNRWGEQVFASPGYRMNWRAEDVAAGVYYYRLRNPPGDRSFNGWVQVLK